LSIHLILKAGSKRVGECRGIRESPSPFATGFLPEMACSRHGWTVGASVVIDFEILGIRDRDLPLAADESDLLQHHLAASDPGCSPDFAS